MSGLISKYFDNSKTKKLIKNIEYKKGDKILKPSEKAKYLYSITEGLVKLYAYDSRGKENIGIIYGPGDVFPLAWIINKERPAIYFEAITKCKLQLIPMVFFQKQIKLNSELSNDFTKRIVWQFALCATIVKNLGLKFGKERLAYRLLVLSAKFGKKRNGEIILPYISHSDLGATINMTRESVNIEMNKLMRQGILKYDRLTIRILKPEKLKNKLGKNESIIFFDNI